MAVGGGRVRWGGGGRWEGEGGGGRWEGKVGGGNVGR